MKRASILRLPSLAVSLGLSFAVVSTSAVFAESNSKSDKKKPAAQSKASPTPSKKAAEDKKAPAADSKLVLKDPVATYDGGKVTKAELEEYFNKQVKAMGGNPADLTGDQRLMAYHQLLDSMIVDRLVEKQTASVEVSQAEVDAELTRLKSQFKSEQEFIDYLKRYNQTPASVQKEIKTGLQGRKWVDSQIDGKDAVDEKEARAFYDANTKEFENPEMVRASHILFLVPEDASDADAKAKLAAAEKAAARIKKGEDFADVAKELSEEPSAKQSGGDLNFFSKTDMVPEFANAAFAQKVGDVSAPVRTKFGYHIIKVTDKKPAGTMSYEEVKDQLAKFLQNQKKRKQAEALIDDLRAKANVKINLPEPKMQDIPPGMVPAPSNP